MNIQVYVALLGALVGGLVALFGVRLSARLAYDQRRKQNTFDLNNQFQELLASRIAAAAILKDNTFPIKTLERNLAVDQFHHISAVLHFFDNLQFLREHDLIDENVAKGLFGFFFKHFNKYFQVLFDAQKEDPKDWSDLVVRVSRLATWLEDGKADSRS